MRTVLFLNNLILVFALLQSSGNPAVRNSAGPADELPLAAPDLEPRELTVTLKAAADTSIAFRAEHRDAAAAPEPEGQKIPHLVLNRNGVPTPGFERTIVVSMENIAVPPTGAYAHLVIETQHGDPDLGGGKANRMRVWDETKFIPYSGQPEALASVDFRVAFQRTSGHPQQEFRTPTDYFAYRIRLLDPQGNLLKEHSGDYAFLMENQWRVPLPPVLEAAPGAAPDELVIYYYDMIPFQTDLRDPYSQVSRHGVERYIQTELIPAMVEAFEIQTNLWDLPWYQEWSNNRVDEDPKTLSVALVEHGTWFHGSPPSLGHAMISIRVDGSFGEYTDLTEGIMSVFHHELFHNQQRNISQHFGSYGNLSGKDEAWKMFSEGTAVLASSVGQPAVQFESSSRLRSYLKRANAFIGSEGSFGGGLNKSYSDIPYHTSIYWRFLYERCGGIQNGVENPRTGMRVIRNILETLYTGEIADINFSADAAGALPRIVDAALEITPSCPFRTHEESLVQFARAIYMLRMEDGRCPSGGNPSGCGFFDPYRLYTSPHAENTLAGAGSTLINGSISTSYGIDLLELALDPSARGKSLKLILRATSTPQDQFQVELFGIQTYQGDAALKRYSTQDGPLGSAQTENGQLVIEIPSLDLEAFNGLGVTILRTDPYESTGSPGNYSIQVLIE